MIWFNKEFKKKQKKRVQYPELNPNKLIIPEDVSLEEVYNRLGRKAKSIINHLQPLVHFIHKYANDNIISISQTAKPLVRDYSAQQNVGRNIQKLINLDVIRKADNKFKNGEYGLMYTINTNNLNTIYINTYDMLSISTSDSIPEVEDDINLHFGKIRKKDNMRDFSDTWVLRKADEVFPQLKHYQEIAEKINLKEPDDDYVIQFEPKIKRDKNGRIKNVSIRATSYFSSIKSRKKHPEFPWYLTCREDVLNKEFGEGWVEYDVKGSVPRIAHFLHTGEWLDANVDPYVEIFKSHFFTWDDETREICKDWFMRIYFGGSVKQIVDKAIKSKDYPDLTADKKERITENITELKEAIDEYCGVADGNSIFLHESCIYLGVREELFKRNIRVIQVYDGFYFAKDTLPDDMSDIIKNSAYHYLNTYIK